MKWKSDNRRVGTVGEGGTYQSNKHRPIYSWVAGESAHVGLNARSGVAAHVDERNIGGVQLRHEHGVPRSVGQRGSSGHVAVVGPDWFTGLAPRKVDGTTGVRERDGAVLADGRTAVFGGTVGAVACVAPCDAGVVAWVGAGGVGGRAEVGVDLEAVGLVEDAEGREVLPRQAGVVGWAAGDVGSQQGPRPALGDADFEPHWHGKETGHLAEGELLARFGGDGLQQQSCRLAGVEVAEEAVDARLAEASEFLAEVEEFSDGLKGVVVGALGGCLWFESARSALPCELRGL